MATTEELIQQKFEEKWAEKQAILAQIEPLRAAYGAKAKEAQAIEAEMRDITDQRKAIEESSGLVELEKELSKLSVAMGGKRLSDAA